MQIGSKSADRTNVSGTATLAGTLQPTVLSASYAPRTFTILNAADGVTGTFTGLPNNAALTLTGIGGSLPTPTSSTTPTTPTSLAMARCETRSTTSCPLCDQQPAWRVQRHRQCRSNGFTPPGSFDALLNPSGPV